MSCYVSVSLYLSVSLYVSVCLCVPDSEWLLTSHKDHASFRVRSLAFVQQGVAELESGAPGLLPWRSGLASC